MLMKIAAGALAAVLGLFSAGALAVLHAGVGTVSVDNEELSLWLPVPMLAADVALMLAPEEAMEEVRRELKPFLPMLELFFAELESSEDLVLVEVQERDESVLVSKTGGSLLVEVHGQDGEDVEIELPLRSVKRLVHSMAAN